MPKTIAIVGAGCAGLGAATALMKTRGADVVATLIEADERIGGRARTSLRPNLPVDLGPQFIQDPEINPWTLIMERTGAFTDQEMAPRDVMGLFRIRQADGWITTMENPGITAMNDQLSAQYEIAAALDNAPIMTGNAPEFCRGQRDVRLSLGSGPLGALAESAEPWQYVAKDRARQSEVESAGNIYVPGGLGTLVSNYGNALLQEFRQRLDLVTAQVVSIDDTGEEKVAVTTADGRVRRFDFCIVTIPPAEVAQLIFAPALSDERLTACGLVTLGSYKKVAFRPTAFPQGDQQVEVWKRNSIEVRCEYFIYDEENDGVWQYFRLPTEPGILICVAAGDFARRLDDMDADAVTLIIRNLLTEAYEGGDFTPSDDGVIVTNWTNEPYVHGAYSYTRYDSAYASDDPVPLAARRVLAEPHGRIHFAGEASWTFAYGTIHGAYYTGIRAANGILKAIRDAG